MYISVYYNEWLVLFVSNYYLHSQIFQNFIQWIHLYFCLEISRCISTLKKKKKTLALTNMIWKSKEVAFLFRAKEKFRLNLLNGVRKILFHSFYTQCTIQDKVFVFHAVLKLFFAYPRTCIYINDIFTFQKLFICMNS